MLKNLLKKLLPKTVIEYLREKKSNIFDSYAQSFYSQEGEDVILRRLFGNKKNGFYIDVGAHHPKRFSNTYLFYKQGWSGINIDAMPNSMKLFRKYRPRDINIEKPISDKKETLTYYMFNEPALNGFSKQLSDSRSKKDYKLISTCELETATLNEILERYLLPEKTIDFLSIDVEGLDLCVIKSLDINRYKPKVILIEILGTTIDKLDNDETSKYLSDFGYKAVAKTCNTVIFENSLVSKIN